MMPRAPTAQCSRAPPVNRLYIPNTPPLPPADLSKNAVSATPSRPGIRTNAINRQTARMATVNKIRDFNSGILKQLVNVLAMEANMGRGESGYGLAGAAGCGPAISQVPPFA